MQGDKMKTKILILGLISLLMLGSILLAKKEANIKSWQDYFPDPVERIYIVMKNEKAFKHTSYDERLIYLGAGALEDFLKRETYEIKDIAIIIHNHRFEQKFSPADWKFYKDLKRRNFNGLFLIYCHKTKEIYDIKGNKT
jgi:hypothetical protein